MASSSSSQKCLRARHRQFPKNHANLSRSAFALAGTAVNRTRSKSQHQIRSIAYDNIMWLRASLFSPTYVPLTSMPQVEYNEDSSAFHGPTLDAEGDLGEYMDRPRPYPTYILYTKGYIHYRHGPFNGGHCCRNLSLTYKHLYRYHHVDFPLPILTASPYFSSPIAITWHGVSNNSHQWCRGCVCLRGRCHADPRSPFPSTVSMCHNTRAGYDRCGFTRTV